MVLTDCNVQVIKTNLRCYYYRLTSNSAWYNNDTLLLPDYNHMSMWLYSVAEDQLRKSNFLLSRSPNVYYMPQYKGYEATSDRAQLFVFAGCCEHRIHAYHRLFLFARPKGNGRSVCYSFTFPRSILCGWVMDENDTLYVVTLSSFNVTELKDAKIAAKRTPAVALCPGVTWEQQVVNLCIYSLDTNATEMEGTYMIPRWHHRLDTVNVHRFWTARQVYDRFSCPFAKKCSASLHDGWLVIRTNSVLFFHTNSSLESAHYSHRCQHPKPMICLTQNGDFLFEHESESLWNKSIHAKRACPLMAKSRVYHSDTKAVVCTHLELQGIIYGGILPTEVTRANSFACRMIEFQLVHPKATAPSRGTPASPGIDLFLPETVDLLPTERATIDLGIRVKLPPGVVGLLLLRAWVARRHKLRLHCGVIGNYRQTYTFNTRQQLQHCQIPTTAGQSRPWSNATRFKS